MTLERRLLGAALATLALALAGCGSSAQPPGGSSAQPPGVSSAQPPGSSSAQPPGGSGSSTASTSGSRTAPTAGAPAPSGALPRAGTVGGPPAPGEPTAAAGTVTLITHDSFGVDKKVLSDFEASSGIKVTLLAQGDAGAMVNKLILTKKNPLGDAVFGIDNTFASRALAADVLAPYASPLAANGSSRYSIGNNRLTPVDYGDVCVNVDHGYFAKTKLAEPVTFEDLAKPAYKNLLVVESPATSSPGLAFLLGTVAHFGDNGWQAYWSKLKDNGVKVTSGWEDAYTVDFSGSSGNGARPLVVSYASSPPSEVKAGSTSAPTSALLKTCFRQVEYAGVLTGAKNPQAARKVVDFLISSKFQAGVADQMYVYPVNTNTQLPTGWQKFAPVAPHPEVIAPEVISTKRDAWISAWSDLMEG
jgi:thiamine transport system substrate-binding protein